VAWDAAAGAAVRVWAALRKYSPTTAAATATSSATVIDIDVRVMMSPPFVGGFSAVFP
jgi:hypothetical protein